MIDVEERKRVLKKYLYLFFVVFFSCSLSVLLFVDNEGNEKISETVITLGLPGEMERQLEVFARNAVVGESFNFGDCSVAKKTGSNEWTVFVCDKQ
ncbi:MAG: hypothetical protein ACOC2M_00525 [bacterium]